MVPVIDAGEPGEEVSDGIAVIGGAAEDIEIAEHHRNRDQCGQCQNHIAQFLLSEVFMKAKVDHRIGKDQRQNIGQLLPGIEFKIVRQP